MTMAQFGRTWWGQRFIAALEKFTDPGRLGRGRSYASGGRILEHTLANGKVTAKVRGSINPYFGVYKEPTYTTTLALTQIPQATWSTVIAHIAENARLITGLLMQELPETIEDAFTQMDLHLLPHSQADFTTRCSCPDSSNPCKHIAGVCYVLAGDLDRDPLHLMELRGLSRETLRAELERSPLGRILSSDLSAPDVAPAPAPSFFTTPLRAPVPTMGHRAFWTGVKRLPAAPAATSRPTVPALLIKKQGDFPAFWPKDSSFISAMEELYERVRTKNGQMK
jgi:uncharacterized Zn finger protein